MNEAEMRNIVKTIIDGIKDAQMQYEYACESKKAGELTYAKKHAEEAAMRLTGVMTWYKMVTDNYSLDDESAAFNAMKDTYVDWYRELHARVTDFRS